MNRNKTINTQGGVSNKGKQGVVIPTAAGKRITSKDRCFQYGGTDNWKHNGKAFFESQKKEHVDALSSSINVVEN